MLRVRSGRLEVVILPKNHYASYILYKNKNFFNFEAQDLRFLLVSYIGREMKLEMELLLSSGDRMSATVTIYKWEVVKVYFFRV